MIEGHDYTIYSNGPGGRARMYALIALITAFLTPLAQHWALALLRKYWGDDWSLAETALIFGGFTALLLFGVLLNLFDVYLWRTRIGGMMFQLAGLSVPPNLTGEYRGTIESFSASNQSSFRAGYVMRIVQSWEQINCALLAENADSPIGMVRVYSDLASIRVGMMSDVTTLRFVYTFEENLPRREGGGTTSRQFSGAATLEFRRQGEAWVVVGHYFDDIGRSGEVSLAQVVPGSSAAVPPTSEPEHRGAAASVDRTA